MEATLIVVRYIKKNHGLGIMLKASSNCQLIESCDSEVEYMSMAMTTSELVWLKGMLEELGVNNDQPPKVYSDIKAALKIAPNPVFHERTKHIEINCLVLGVRAGSKTDGEEERFVNLLWDIDRELATVVLSKVPMLVAYGLANMKKVAFGASDLVFKRTFVVCSGVIINILVSNSFT
ncbi:hypothetical protein F3Y22_tig00110819pilonHSYRG00314 [Hibiscus syriacus]|uniref:Uncharacterized protein n=1 Tax=Hibiscus syriacus TaxID=106335 RepID=A0A6A2ZM47_HIBSY|nr:hypothetical protein F3Y22_tig00110819pilonHSYRG00314 [Hibiscus syriacus]